LRLKGDFIAMELNIGVERFLPLFALVMSSDSIHKTGRFETEIHHLFYVFAAKLCA